MKLPCIHTIKHQHYKRCLVLSGVVMFVCHYTAPGLSVIAECVSVFLFAFDPTIVARDYVRGEHHDD